jgi:ring-1,2-phenylacetyl-CoA epoxidase subunit PaaC
MCEFPNGDYAFTIARQCIIDCFQLHYYTELQKSQDETIAGITAKALKETTYHFRHSSSWMERFGNGTEESHLRLQNAINDLWRFTDDLFDTTIGYSDLVSKLICPQMNSVKIAWEKTMDKVLTSSTIKKPENVFMQKGSINNVHTEHLGFLLTEMQYLQRAYPGAKW